MPARLTPLTDKGPDKGPVEDPAASMGLRYAVCAEPGIRRVRSGRGFRYLDTNGKVPSSASLQRIESLAVPPAWTDVWICADPNGHLQAAGVDARGRRQYIYHPQWRQARDETKFDRLAEFGLALPGLRRAVEADLGQRGMPKDRVTAAVVRLLDSTALRIGNREYRRENGTFGATTLLEDHVDVTGTTIELALTAKGNKLLRLSVSDQRLARAVRRLQELPGQELFRYLNGDGGLHSIGSADVNAYLQRRLGCYATAKDFRVWLASVEAGAVLAHMDSPSSTTQAKRAINAALDEAAAMLGNTRAVCRASYVHPVVPRAFEEAWIGEAWSLGRGRLRRKRLRPEESGLLGVLTAGTDAQLDGRKRS